MATPRLPMPALTPSARPCTRFGKNGKMFAAEEENAPPPMPPAQAHAARRVKLTELSESAEAIASATASRATFEQTTAVYSRQSVGHSEPRRSSQKHVTHLAPDDRHDEGVWHAHRRAREARERHEQRHVGSIHGLARIVWRGWKVGKGEDTRVLPRPPRTVRAAQSAARGARARGHRRAHLGVGDLHLRGNDGPDGPNRKRAHEREGATREVAKRDPAPPTNPQRPVVLRGINAVTDASEARQDPPAALATYDGPPPKAPERVPRLPEVRRRRWRERRINVIRRRCHTDRPIRPQRCRGILGQHPHRHPNAI